MTSDKCDRCGQVTPDGDGTHYKGERYCPDCAEIELFWQTIETDEPEPSQRSYSWGELATLTHKWQVRIFGWCSCEDGDKQYSDCEVTA